MHDDIASSSSSSSSSGARSGEPAVLVGEPVVEAVGSEVGGGSAETASTMAGEALPWNAAGTTVAVGMSCVDAGSATLEPAPQAAAGAAICLWCGLERRRARPDRALQEWQNQVAMR